MTISEARRFELHGKLRDVLGDEMGTTLMEHLPPGGWGRVAQHDDIERLTSSIQSLEARVDSIEEGVRSLRSSIRLMIGMVVATAATLLVMFIQLNLTIATLPR